MTASAHPSAPRQGNAERLTVRLLSDPPGVIEVSGRPHPFLVIHVGRSVQIECKRGGRLHRGLSVHGDVDIIPAGMESRWEIKEKDTALILRMPTELLRSVAEQTGADPAHIELVNRFQMRDRHIEHIGWALKAELEAGFPNGGLYLDSLGMALAVHLLRSHSALPGEPQALKGGMGGRRLKQVLAFIEENLKDDLSLEDVAAVAGMSVSHCKTAFRESTGVPIHRYVIERRVERATALLREGNLPISQIAVDTGFAHQSHLAYHVRRTVGVSPKAFRRRCE